MADQPEIPTGPLSEYEIRSLRRMVKDYDHAVWFRAHAKIWVMWGLGLPAAVVGFWTPVHSIWELIRGMFTKG